MLDVRQPTRKSYAALGLGLVLFMVIFGYQVSRVLGHGSQEAGEAPGGSPIAQMFYLAGFAAALCAVDPFRDLRRLLVLPITLTVTLAWCWLSLTWSLAPPIALRRVMMVTILAWTIFVCVRELGYVKSLSLLRLFLAAAIAISLVLIFALPGYAQQSTNGVVLLEGAKGWRGISIDKNAFGSLVGLAMLVFVADNRVGHPAYRWSFAGLAFVCLVGCLSKTALAVTLIVLPIAFVLSRIAPARRALLIPAALCLAAGLFLIHDDLIRPFSEARYDPEAFTGRGLIWNALWPYFQEHPMFGAGFGSFWSIGYDSPIFTYARSEWVTKIAQGHNGYLDLLVTIGIPGMIMAVTTFFVVPIVKMLIDVHIHPNIKFLVMAVLLYAFGNNFTESTLLSRDTLPNVLVLIVLAVMLNAARTSKPALAPVDVGPPILMRPADPQV